jgi:Na+/proline symporter
VLLLGYVYFHLAGEAYALVSIGLISFRRGGAVRAGAAGRHVLEGRHARGALAGLLAGFALWAYTLMLPSIAKSGWWTTGFLEHGPWGMALLRPNSCWAWPGWTT